MPQAGELRARVRVLRRGAANNVGGVVKDGWAVQIAKRSAKLLPTRTGGGEAVIAGRLSGQTPWDCWLRSDSATRGITAADRVEEIAVDADGVYVETLREFAITAPPMDMDGRRQWLLLQLQEGVADG